MMKFLHACSQIAAGGLAIAFVVSALAALLLFNMQSHFLNPNTYKSVLDEQGVYERLPAILAKQIAFSMANDPSLENPEERQDEDSGAVEINSPPPYLRNLTTEDWEQLLSLLLTPEWTKSQIESVLDQFFAFLESDQEKLTIAVSLLGLKENLTGQKGMEFIRILINAQPPCSETLLDLLLEAAIGNFSPDQILLCRPPEELMDELAPTMEDALDLVIDDLPDEVILGKRLFGGDDNALVLSSDKPSDLSFQTVRTLLRFSPILPILFLLLLTLFSVRSMRGLLFCWGVPFIIVGLSALSVGLAALPLLNWGWETFVLGSMPRSIDPSSLDLFIDSARLLVHVFVRAIANQSVLVAFVGITMTAAGLLSIYKSEKQPE